MPFFWYQLITVESCWMHLLLDYFYDFWHIIEDTSELNNVNLAHILENRFSSTSVCDGLIFDNVAAIAKCSYSEKNVWGIVCIKCAVALCVQKFCADKPKKPNVVWPESVMCRNCVCSSEKTFYNLVSLEQMHPIIPGWYTEDRSIFCLSNTELLQKRGHLEHLNYKCLQIIELKNIKFINYIQELNAIKSWWISSFRWRLYGIYQIFLWPKSVDQMRGIGGRQWFIDDVWAHSCTFSVVSVWFGCLFD